LTAGNGHDQMRGTMDDGLTGLELAILVLVLIVVAALLLEYIGGSGTPVWARTFPNDLVAESMYMFRNHLQTCESITRTVPSGIQPVMNLG
jgi:hypothetical protein